MKLLEKAIWICGFKENSASAVGNVASTKCESVS